MYKNRLILSLFLILGLNGASLAQNEKPALTSPNKDWKIDFNTRVGASTRIKATEQNPLPFCFATAATMLLDQQRCMADNKDCGTQQASSFLAAVPAGQNLELGLEIDIKNGGSPIPSLRHLINNGTVSYNKCNYSQIKPDNTVIGYQLTHETNPARIGWLRYKDYTPYLERFFRKQFIRSLQDINPNITEDQATVILETPMTDNKLASLVLINPDCWKDAIKDNRFVGKFKKIENKLNAKEAFSTINKLLKEKRAVIINFCTTPYEEIKCHSNNMHSAIIIAKATAQNQITGDQRTVYWVVNSWGEEWQEKHRDGWVFADNLLSGINGELVWLESK